MSFLLSVIFAECHKQAYYAECHHAKCRFAECHEKSITLSVYIPSVIRLSFIMLSVIYALGTRYYKHSVNILSVVYAEFHNQATYAERRYAECHKKLIVLSVIMLSVVMLNVTKGSSC